jgi:putative RNA 2'-phosphotransferase
VTPVALLRALSVVARCCDAVRMQPLDREDVRRSKLVARVLRHQPGSVGIVLDRNGWADVAELLAALSAHGHRITRADLERVVDRNDKHRFEWDTAHDRIRARQGHSVEVDLELVPTDPPDRRYHGTPRRNVGSMLETGLERRGRRHVHLSEDAVAARRVGARRGDPVVVVVDAAAMAAASGAPPRRATSRSVTRWSLPTTDTDEGP